jgi:hypothetical protein
MKSRPKKAPQEGFFKELTATAQAPSVAVQEAVSRD